MEPATPPDRTPDWRLGDPTQPAAQSSYLQPPAEAGRPRSASHRRLEHPLHVLTVEHLAWAAIAIWAVFSRFVILAARPLSPVEARTALYSYDLLNRTSEAAAAGFQPLWSGWVYVVQAGIFGLGSSGNFAARWWFGLSGLLLIAMAFEFRHYIGRAGAIALGAMLALSPTVTWMSRYMTGAICAAALALVTVALFMALLARPNSSRAAALGVSGGLMLSADPTGAATAAIFVVALAVLGFFQLLVTRNAMLRSRVWLTRYGTLVAIVVVVAIGIAVASQALIGLPGAGLNHIIGYLSSPRWAHWRVGRDALVLVLGFYDFQIVVAGLIGVVVVITTMVRHRFAVFCLLWTVLSAAFALLAVPPAPSQLLTLLVPAAVLGALAVDYLHSRAAWNQLRWVAAAFIIFTLHAQSFANFDDYVPDTRAIASQTRANLFWSDGATTPQMVERATAITRNLAPAGATVFFSDQLDWPPALRWYLRDLRPVQSEETAAVVIDTRGFDAGSRAAQRARIDYEETWRPDPTALNFDRALLYFFTQQPWGELVIRSALIEPGPAATRAAPTLILPP